MSDKHGTRLRFEASSVTIFAHFECIELLLREHATTIAAVAVLTMHANITPNGIMLEVASMTEAHTFAHPAQGKVLLYTASAHAHLAIVTIITSLLIWNRPRHIIIGKHAMRLDDAVMEAVTETSWTLDGLITAAEHVAEPVLAFFFIVAVVESDAGVLTGLAERAVDTEIAEDRIMLDILREMYGSLTFAFVTSFILVRKTTAAVATGTETATATRNIRLVVMGTAGKMHETVSIANKTLLRF